MSVARRRVLVSDRCSASPNRATPPLQCRKLLWWKVHEPEAPELAADDALQTRLNRGLLVGEQARAHVPGGVLIDLPYDEYRGPVDATARAIADGAPAVYEASFLEDDVFVSVDILQRRRDGYVVTEVKSTTSVKDQHVADVAIQAHVVGRAGLPVKSVEVMHLNKECRHPALSDLFVRKSVTREIRPHLRAAPAQIEQLKTTLAGPLPEVAVGPHCGEPYDCPFVKRCWPPTPPHHVSTLYRIQKTRAAELLAQGHTTIAKLPRGFEAKGPTRRQVRSVRKGTMIVERGLRRALARIKGPIAFLDFETIAPAIPVWPGCRPYQAVPVQFSCHRSDDPDEPATKHHAWLADGSGDPRRALATALLAARDGARSVLSYGAFFEKRCIADLADALPDLARALTRLNKRIHDLLPIVRDNVYHPDFGGGFGLKAVLPALVPGLGYGDLEIREGMTASSLLEALLLDADALTEAERAQLRRNLLAYCERDTLAMVRLWGTLRELARDA